MKKLYKVNLSVDIDMMVIAESVEEANGIAYDNFIDELELQNEDPLFRTSSISKIEEIPSGWMKSLPYSSRVDEKELSCEKWYRALNLEGTCYNELFEYKEKK